MPLQLLARRWVQHRIPSLTRRAAAGLTFDSYDRPHILRQRVRRDPPDLRAAGPQSVQVPESGTIFHVVADQSLVDLIGKDGAFEEQRDGFQWVAALLGVPVFLALVASLFQNVLSP